MASGRLRGRSLAVACCCLLLLPVSLFAVPAGAIGPPLFPQDYGYTATLKACNAGPSGTTACTPGTAGFTVASGDDIKIEFDISCNVSSTNPTFSANHCENRPFVLQLGVGGAALGFECYVEGDILQFNPLVNGNALASSAEPFVGGNLLEYTSAAFSVGAKGSFTIPEHPNVTSTKWAATNSTATVGTSVGEIQGAFEAGTLPAATAAVKNGHLCIGSAELYGDPSYTDGSGGTVPRGFPGLPAGVGLGVANNLVGDPPQKDPYCQPACSNLDTAHRFAAVTPINF